MFPADPRNGRADPRRAACPTHVRAAGAQRGGYIYPNSWFGATATITWHRPGTVPGLPRTRKRRRRSPRFGGVAPGIGGSGLAQ